MVSRDEGAAAAAPRGEGAGSAAARSGGEGAPPAADRWWRGGVGYQIYIRSFSDASGDGIGDLAGIRRHLPHVAELGVDCIWITPFYPSPQADHGYDVADYTGVDPDYGSVEELRALVDEAHAAGLRVIIDIVPNHTSDQHPWFREASASRDADLRDYYVWRDPAPDGGPPNNWVSKFGGPAWTHHPTTGQWYLHHFLPEQPDLNWADERVRAEFDRILAFWLDVGVDGFRIDTAHLLAKDAELRDNPRARDVPADADPDAVYHSFDHLYDLDQPEVVEVYRRWRRIVASHGAVLLGEVALFEPELLPRYVDDALDLTFCFPAMQVPWEAGAIRETLGRAVAVAGDAFAWPLSSHDDPRAAERFGGGPLGARRALAYLTLLSGLPGTVFILQGDELGLDHGELSAAELRDPISVRNPGAAGRDGSRTPMPWRPGPNLGFSEAEPWLAHPRSRTEADTAAVQEADERSPLHRTRQLFAVRRSLPALRGGLPVRWLAVDEPLVGFRRGSTVVALNTGDTPQRLTLGRAELHYASADGAEAAGDVLTLPANSAVIATAPVASA